MLELCAAMKAQDIIMYTITFQVTNATHAEPVHAAARPTPTRTSTRRATASSQEAFEQIADELSNLRIAE